MTNGKEDNGATGAPPVPPPGNEATDPLVARKEFLQIFQKGAEFTEELMKENERLRYRLAQAESRGGGGTSDDALLKELMAKVSRLEREREQMLQRFNEVEAENRDFASRYVEIETENNNLLNIYVASYQLHSTLDFEEVLQIITEIILNFIGAEIFGIVLLDEKTQTLKPLVAEGVDPSALGNLPVGEGLLRRVLETGEVQLAENIDADAGGEPTVVVPLMIKGSIIGIIVIYKFLQQKIALENVDHELFTLLAGHAATAIFSARLYSDSQRKLSTIQGLIDLVSS